MKDRWRYERALRSGSKSYLSIANRSELLQVSPDHSGYACLWKYTSRLHAPLVQPQLGKRLLQRCLQDSPIAFSDKTVYTHGIPQLSVLIGHRGTERLPLLLKTLQSFAAQEHVDLECIVIESDSQPVIRKYLPSWVQYIFSYDPEGSLYNRSKTFNVGTRHAKGDILLLHDNDMLVPKNYGSNILHRVNQGYDVVNPKRFIFYLSKEYTRFVLNTNVSLDLATPDYIVQNLEAGGSMAIKTQSYHLIGGMDEQFIGWGGEDNEFWDRCLTLPAWIWGYEPIVHLWHQSQPLKADTSNPNIMRYKEIIQLPALERIHRLRSKSSLF